MDLMKLFISPASALSIGELAGVKLVFSETRDASLHCGIRNLVMVNDEFGDAVIHLDVAYHPTVGIPFQKLRLLHPSGETGFDTPTVSNRVIHAFLGGSYLATDLGQLSPSNDYAQSDPIDLMRIFEKRGRCPLMITYHQPDVRLWTYLNSNPFSETDAIANLKTLIGSIKHCETALLWSWAYGLNPVLLSENPEKFLDSLRSRTDEHELAIIKVETEGELPEW